MEQNEQIKVHTGELDLQETGQGSVEDIDEIFTGSSNGVNFRTLSWPAATVIFIKLQFSTGILSIPSNLSVLGAVGGAISIVGWTTLAMYVALIFGDFRARHGRCHTVADMAYIVGGPLLREIIGTLFILANILAAGSTIIAISTGISIFSHNATCSVWWALLTTAAVMLGASIRKIHKLGWLTWVAFGSIFTAVMVVVVGVTLRARPAAAPQSGSFDLGFYAVPSTRSNFAQVIVASCAIIVSSGGTAMMVPIISEMRNPAEYKKAIYLSQTFVIASYLSLSMVIYAYCGTWVASPSLGVSLAFLIRTPPLTLHDRVLEKPSRSLHTVSVSSAC